MAVGERIRHARRTHPHDVQPLAVQSGQSIIAFDYAATFELTGTPGNLIQDVINFDVDSVFVATAIGYGLEDIRFESMSLVGPPSIPNWSHTTPYTRNSIVQPSPPNGHFYRCA